MAVWIVMATGMWSDGCLDGHGDRDVVSQACQQSHKVVGFYLLK